jgi:hypothetical protein
MTRGMRARFLSAGFVLCSSTMVRAWAATMRPNGVDHRVDRLSAQTLLTRPAAALVDPERQIAAAHFVHWYLPGWFLSVLFPVLALIYFWRSGSAAHVRDTLRRRFGNETLVRFGFGATLGAIVRIAALFPDVYLYRIERLVSQNDQLLRAWGADWLLTTIAWMAAVGLVTAGVLWLVERTHQWYIYTIATIFAVAFLCAYIAPYAGVPLFDRIVPLPRPVVSIAAKLETQAHVSIPIVEQVRRRSHLGMAYVVGLGASQRIVIGDAVVAVAGPSEMRYMLARQLGFRAAQSTWRIALIDALMLIVGTAIAVAIADRIGFRRDDDAVSRLAIVGALLGVLYFIAVPVDNALLRSFSASAGQYALALRVDRAAAVRSVVRETDQRLTEVCPDIMARLFMEREPDSSVQVNALNGVPTACP